MEDEAGLSTSWFIWIVHIIHSKHVSHGSFDTYCNPTPAHMAPLHLCWSWCTGYAVCCSDREALGDEHVADFTCGEMWAAGSDLLMHCAVGGCLSTQSSVVRSFCAVRGNTAPRGARRQFLPSMTPLIGLSDSRWVQVCSGWPGSQFRCVQSQLPHAALTLWVFLLDCWF